MGASGEFLDRLANRVGALMAKGARDAFSGVPCVMAHVAGVNHVIDVCREGRAIAVKKPELDVGELAALFFDPGDSTTS